MTPSSKKERQMAENNFTLDTFYGNWRVYQNQLEAAIAPLTDEQLTLRVAPDLRSVGQIATHIISVRVGWFVRFLGEDVGEAEPLREWQMPEAPPRTTAELVKGLEVSWRMMADALTRWSSNDMAHVISRERGKGEMFTQPRSWVIWHLLEHDLHHGGELSLSLGAHGLQAPDM
jgi:uncharacterized damage-inducible protein DinB